MGMTELILLAVGLAMDAFAVSICKGLAIRQGGEQFERHGHSVWAASVTAGLWFGGFQMLMPLAGYFLGAGFLKKIEAFDHWIAFGLLLLVGINMLRESFGEENKETADMRFLTMLLLAIATSIDALAVGITFAVLRVRVILSSALIGVITFFISAMGVRIGSWFGARWRRPAQIAGGLILIGIGIRILISHMLG